MNTDHYTYRVTWSAEDAEHVGLCAEFPSLSWLAKTPEAKTLITKTIYDLLKTDPTADIAAALTAAQDEYNGQFP